MLFYCPDPCIHSAGRNHYIPIHQLFFPLLFQQLQNPPCRRHIFCVTIPIGNTAKFSVIFVINIGRQCLVPLFSVELHGADAVEIYIDCCVSATSYNFKSRKSSGPLAIPYISYLVIKNHTITTLIIHGDYQKSGTLKQEPEILTDYGFAACSQSCIVSLYHVQSVIPPVVHLQNETELKLSQRYTK